MSELHIRLREQEKSCREFESELKALYDDLGLRVPVKFLELRVRLLEQLVEKTGGSLRTQDYRVSLAGAKKCVALRAEARRAQSRSLHIVRMS